MDKIILPAEVKVCATCSYWDGERQVDEEMQVIVVEENCEGECLAQETSKPGLHDVRAEHVCIWENTNPDPVEATGENSGERDGNRATPGYPPA